jgi:hypothetical protein
MPTARAKYQEAGSPPKFKKSLPENPRKDYDEPGARPPGKSGGVLAHTPHKKSSSVRKMKKRSPRRG